MNKYIQYIAVLSALTLLIQLQAVTAHSKNVPRPSQAGNHIVHIVKDSLGNYMAVWCQDTTEEKYAIFGSVLKNGVWQAPDKISPDYIKDTRLVTPIAPHICSGAQLHAIVIWAGLDEKSQPVLYATVYVPGTVPAVIDIISGAAHYIWHPSLCSNTAGKALIVWQQDDTQGHDAIYKAVYMPDQSPRITGPDKVYATDGTTKISFSDVRYDNGQATIMWYEHKINTDGAHIFNAQPLNNFGPHDWLTGMGMHTIKIAL